MIDVKKIRVPDERPPEAAIVAPTGTARIYGPRQIDGGGWHHTILDGRPVVTFYCPTCGREGKLDHQIADDGTVTPSVVCPHDGCTFHDNVRLLDYEA